jgi:AraC family transcriptional activator of mtrCDE
MSAIDVLISQADVRGSLDLRCLFQGDWAVEHEQENVGVAPYHILLAGQCWVQMPDGLRIKLVAGDILVLPRGASHILRSDGSKAQLSVPQPISRGLLPVRIVGDGSEVDLLCGRFIYQRESILFSELPSHLLISGSALGQTGSLSLLVQLIRDEVGNNRRAAQFMVNALTSALFALVIRAHLEQSPQNEGALALLSDKRLSRAWQAILEAPDHDWSIEALAELANMSRATFMRAFNKRSGSSPWALLTKVRMERAYGLLLRTDQGLDDIAAQVGYQSQAAFSKVFKITYGSPPGQIRRGLVSSAGHQLFN